MKLFITFTVLLVAVAVASVFSQEQDAETVEVAHHRSKRSPYDPLLPALVVGKSFLLGSLLGPKIFHKGWGAPRHGGWGWHGPARHGGGWGGWSSGWSSPVVTVSHGWGWH